MPLWVYKCFSHMCVNYGVNTPNLQLYTCARYNVVTYR